jgi:microsomal dipeptidase-like Zn-dependent dipeptidase
VLQFHKQIYIADLHADNLLWDRDPLTRLNHGHVDIPRLIEGNICVQVFDAVIKMPMGHNYYETKDSWDQITFLAMANRWPVRTWFSLAERALHQSDLLHETEIRSGGQLEIIRSSNQLGQFLNELEADPHRVGGILSIEGLHALEGKIDNLKRFYEAGYRIMGLTHFFDNALGGSSGGVKKGGISEFGKQVIHEMDQLELIIDLAHASPSLIVDVLEITDRPVVVSHTGVQGTVDIPRNLSDGELAIIGSRGGLIGIGFWDDVVGDLQIESIVAAIQHAVTIAGIDHIALGSDFDGATHILFDASEMVVLTDALLKAGFSRGDVAKIMGGNQIRFLMEHLPQGN